MLVEKLLFFQQQQILGRRFYARKMHLSPQWPRLLSVLRRWFCCLSHCLLLLSLFVGWELCLHGPCIVMWYLVPFIAFSMHAFKLLFFKVIYSYILFYLFKGQGTLAIELNISPS